MSEAEKNSAQCAESRDDGSSTSQDDKPKITLDRYLSRRRSPARAPVMQIASLLMMLIALIMILVYKDQCGLLTADFFGGMDDKQEQQQPKSKSTGSTD